MQTSFKLRLSLITFAISLLVLAAHLPAQPVQSPQQSGTATPPPLTAPADPSTESQSFSDRKLSPHEQVQADTKKLYQLAFELRTEVGKTYKQSLSLDVLRKAQELEKLAKTLKSEMDHDASAKKR